MARVDPVRLPALSVDVLALQRQRIDVHPLAVELPVAWVAQSLAQTDAEVQQPGALRLELSILSDRTVLVRGRLELSFMVPCARCLEPAHVDGSAALCWTFVPTQAGAAAAVPPGGDDEGEVALGSEDLETIGYEGATLELEAIVAEQVALAYPMRALCARGETCRGLCTNCGADLNEAFADGHCAQCGLAVAVPGSGADPAAVGRDWLEGEAKPPWQAALGKLRRPT